MRRLPITRFKCGRAGSGRRRRCCAGTAELNFGYGSISNAETSARPARRALIRAAVVTIISISRLKKPAFDGFQAGDGTTEDSGDTILFENGAGAMTEQVDTHSKALAINLDSSIFGSFAEIGAGQETARWFLRVGAASGTVAKTICAYDKAVSDDLYGSGSRYVSKERLQAMIAAEWVHLEQQLATRSERTRAFVFANTVAARNYAGTNQCHGWLGLQFCPQIGSKLCGVVLHVNLLDDTNVSQQESLGTLGVNLIYGAYHQLQRPDTFLAGLGDDVGLQHLEIDFIETYGEPFEEWEQRSLFARLVCGGLAAGVLLPHSGEYLALNEAFYKTPVVAEPGQFEDREPIHNEMLAAAVAQLRASMQSGSQPAARLPRAMFCLFAGEHDAATLVGRAEKLLDQGYDVLLTRHSEMYRISKQLRDFTENPIRFVIGLSAMVRLINLAYAELQGRILEGVSRLFTQDVGVYVHPMSEAVLRSKVPEGSLESWEIPRSEQLVEADQIHPPMPIGLLYSYLLASRLIEPLRLASK